MFCPDRIKSKRPPPSFDSVIADFPSGFNFNKVKDNERLYNVKYNNTISQATGFIIMTNNRK